MLSNHPKDEFNFVDNFLFFFAPFVVQLRNLG